MEPEDRTVALVSGCSTGIGHFVAKRFAELGVTVVAGARSPENLVDLAMRGQPFIHPVGWDVADAESTRRAVLGTIERFGKIDLLVNNAGYGQMGPLVEVSRDLWRRQMETNVIGLADAASWAARAPGGMIDRRSGRIVNIGSVIGRVAIPWSGVYCASKFAVEAISDALRMELAPFGIDVVLVEPGSVHSSFSDNAKKTVVEILAREHTAYDYLRPAIRRRMETTQGRSAPTEACAEAIVRAALMRRPPTRVVVTSQAKMLLWARWILPDRTLDAILRRRFGLRGDAPVVRAAEPEGGSPAGGSEDAGAAGPGGGAR